MVKKLYNTDNLFNFMPSLELGYLSPLFLYWKSEQSDLDEDKRLSILDRSSKAAKLFEDEPYKWENLYQSCLREVISGDLSAVSALNILLATIKKDEKDKIIKLFEENEIIPANVCEKIKSGCIDIKTKKKNYSRFFRILLSIFTNPFNLEIKGGKNHIYERTGTLIFKIRKKINMI